MAGGDYEVCDLCEESVDVADVTVVRVGRSKKNICAECLWQVSRCSACGVVFEYRQGLVACLDCGNEYCFGCVDKSKGRSRSFACLGCGSERTQAFSQDKKLYHDGPA